MSSEYEALISEHGSLKANYKQLRVEHKSVEDRFASVSREQETVAQLKEKMERDTANLKSESQHYGNLQMDYIQIREENLKV